MSQLSEKPIEFREFNPFSPAIEAERAELRSRAELVIESIAQDFPLWKLSRDELRSMAWARFEGHNSALILKLLPLHLPSDHPIRAKLCELWNLSIPYHHRLEETLRKIIVRHEQEKLAVPESGAVARSLCEYPPKTGSIVLIGNERHAWQVTQVPGMAPRFFGWYEVEFGPPTFWLSPTEFVEGTIVPPLYGPA